MASLLPESVRSVEEERREGKGKSGQAVAAPQAAGKVYFITDGESSMSVRWCICCLSEPGEERRRGGMGRGRSGRHFWPLEPQEGCTL